MFSQRWKILFAMCGLNQMKTLGHSHYYIGFLKGDIDFSPLFAYKAAKCSGDLFENIRSNPLYTVYGREFFRLCGVIDDDLNLIGTVKLDMVRQNRDAIVKLFKLKPPYDQEWIDFICL